jgi:ABC-type multidrug transport system permease subunit
MPERASGFILGIVTIAAAVMFTGGIVEGLAQTRPNRWTIAAEQLYHGVNT